MTQTINKEFFLKEYFDIRHEMTAWFQRLTLTYNFCLLALVTLFGSQLLIFKIKDDNVKLLLIFLTTIMVLIVSTGSARMMGRIYSAIFRQGSYLRVYYRPFANWIENNRVFWELHDKQSAVPQLRWIRSGEEVKIMVGLLFGFGIASIILLYISSYGMECKMFCNAFFIVIFATIILLSVIILWAVSLYRLWETKKHKKLWEEGWQELLDSQRGVKEIIGRLCTGEGKERK